jgi:hypothetical protein
MPAFLEIRSELEKYDLRITISNELEADVSISSATMSVESINDGDNLCIIEKFSYKVASPDEVTVWVDICYMEGKIIREEIRKTSVRTPEEDDIYSISTSDIIDNFLYHYRRYI